MEKQKQHITLHNIQNAVRDRIIFWWLTHCYLRNIGKRYPDHFIKLMNDITDNHTARKIMALRYTGDNPLKFEAISYELNIDIRNVFKHHKSVIDSIISGV